MADRKKLFIAIGLLVVIGVVAGVVFFMRSRAEAPAPSTTAQAPAAPEQASPPAEAPAAAPAEEGAAPEAAEAAKPKPAAPLTGSAEPYRMDPFQPFPYRPVKPLPLVVRSNFPVVTLARVQTWVGVGPPTSARRRVAGLLRDDRVWAILDIEGRTTVVKPGDIVEEGVVQAITEDGLLLTVPEKAEPVVIPLARGVAAPAPAAAGRPGLTPARVPVGMPARPGYAMPPGAVPMGSPL